MVDLGFRRPGSAGWAESAGRVIDALLIASAFISIAWAAVQRVGYTNETFGTSIGCANCLSYSIIVHDLAFLSSLTALLIASFLVRRYFLYLPLRLLCLAGFLVYLADIIVMQEFFTRLMIDDVSVYATQVQLVWRYILSSELWAHADWMLVPLLGWTTLFLAKPPARSASVRPALIILAIPVSGLLAGSFITPPSYVHDWALRNVIDANFATGVTEPYSEQFSRKLLSAHDEEREMQCREGQDRSPDVVLLILESWSPYQSELYSGINNWTPRLDQLARNNTWFANMHAGGFSTNEGLISLLTGLDFIAPQKSWFEVRPFETAWNTTDTMPEALKGTKGYFTAFLTSGNLSFSRKREWLEHLGFDYLEGHDHTGYDGVKKRLHFDSVPDSMLYERSVEFIAGLKQEAQPFFVAIESVSSHHPYIHPETGERSQEAVFRYMDATAGEFHSRLESTGFFDNGILLIISDHRAMIPISPKEQAVFGQASASLIPAILVAGPQWRGKIEHRFHQSDLVSSMQELTSRQYCHTGPFRTVLRPDESEPRCIYHARGDNRDHIDAFCPEGNYLVELDGDRTRIIQAGSRDRLQNRRILQQINAIRILGNQRQDRRASAHDTES